MEHEDIKDLLSDYHDGELSGAKKAALDSHLAGCTDCRAELSRYRKGEGIIRAAAGRPTSFETETLVGVVRSRLESSPEVAWLGRLLASPRWAVPAFAVAFAALAAAVRTAQVQYDPSEALLISQDDGRTYALITSTPESASAVDPELR